MRIHRWWSGDDSSFRQWTKVAVGSTHPGVPLNDVLVESVDDPRRASNLWRCQTLHEEGGLWLDCDVIPLAYLMRSKHPWTASLGGMRELAVMFFPRPGHPFLAEMIRRLPDHEGTGSSLATQISPEYPDLMHRRDVLGFDAVGRVAYSNPSAIHLWHSSVKNIYGNVGNNPEGQGL